MISNFRLVGGKALNMATEVDDRRSQKLLNLEMRVQN